MKKSEFKIVYSPSTLRIINQVAFSLTDDYATEQNEDPICCECNFHNVPLDIIQEVHIWAITRNCTISTRKGLISHFDSSKKYDEVSITNENGKGIASLYSVSY